MRSNRDRALLLYWLALGLSTRQLHPFPSVAATKAPWKLLLDLTDAHGAWKTRMSSPCHAALASCSSIAVQFCLLRQAPCCFRTSVQGSNICGQSPILSTPTPLLRCTCVCLTGHRPSIFLTLWFLTFSLPANHNFISLSQGNDSGLLCYCPLL